MIFFLLAQSTDFCAQLLLFFATFQAKSDCDCVYVAALRILAPRTVMFLADDCYSILRIRVDRF